MGAAAAEDYVKAWIGIVSDSDLGAKQREELENELSDIDWSDMSDAMSGMKAMTERYRPCQNKEVLGCCDFWRKNSCRKC